MVELHYLHGLALFIAAVGGLAIAHRAVLRLPTGLPRLVFILPTLPIFFMLPWTIPIYHLRAILSFIFLWTVPSKLLLLCWDAGIDYPSSGFLYFATIVMMPIRVKGRKAEKQAPCSTHNSRFWWQFIAVIIILNIYSYRNGLPICAIYVLYTCHMYLGLELMLGGLAKLATACFGVESDPQFNNPFMSASLSEFWGRRWNLVVTTILRSTVYNPALLLLMRAEKHKAHQSKPQENPCASKTSPLSQAPDAQKHTSMDADTNSKQTDEMKSSKPSDAKPLASEPTLQMLEVALLESSSPSSGNATDNSLYAMEKCSPNQGIHPSSNLEAQPEEGTQHTDLPIANVVADINNGTHNPNSDLSCDPTDNSGDESESVCNHCSFSTCHPNDGCSPECNHSTNESGFLLSRPNLKATPCQNPTTNPGKDRPTLRARTVAMLARAAKQRTLPAFTRSDDADPKLNPATMGTIEAEGKSGEKPSLRARAVAMLVTFAVSGLVHELIFYYINKSRATGEITAFFILHGCATAIEVLLKKTMMAHLHLPRPLSIALTLAFLYTTAAWLFMPPLTRYGADINTIAEYQRFQSALFSLFTNTQI